ncbi:protein FMC1 homolog [Bufo gargarizans]|uniref:protein FMC1 homolog n=1 Tax=Bufo gargarizans TaxID=30331 RepID=UPI001CF3BFEF|nr:protein FMC1 homolog [Bufo gargarizans]
MSFLGKPLQTFRCLLRELRQNYGVNRYRKTVAYSFIRAQFSRNQVTSEKLCLAHQELHFQASTYLCLLQSVRNHIFFHEEYHGKGERTVEEVAGLVGFKIPQQPGGKGLKK